MEEGRGCGWRMLNSAVGDESSSDGAREQNLSGACATAESSCDIDGVANQRNGLSSWRSEKPESDRAQMKTDANSGH